MKKIMEIKQGWLLIFMVCLMSLSAVSMTGCAGKTKTSTVMTETSNGVGTTSSVTTQSQTTTDAHPRGVIGGVFYTIGQIILFPFRVIGNLFS